MITYKEIFEGLKRSGLGGQRKMVVLDPKNAIRAAQMIQILCHAEIAIYDPATKTYGLHPKQIKPALQVLPNPTETPLNGDLSDLGRVRVDWSGRGHSSGSYAVKAEDERSYTIANGTDENKPTKLRISKARCEKVTVVVAKAA